MQEVCGPLHTARVEHLVGCDAVALKEDAMKVIGGVAALSSERLQIKRLIVAGHDELSGAREPLRQIVAIGLELSLRGKIIA